MLPGEMPAHDNAEGRAAPPAALLVDLQDHAVEAHGVVAGDDPLLFVTEDLIEIDAADGHKRAGGICRRTAKGGVVVREEALAQILVGGGHRADLGHSELVDEAALQRAVGPLAPAAGLRREPDDVLDAELGQRAADLRELLRSGALPEVGVYTAQPARSV